MTITLSMFSPTERNHFHSDHQMKFETGDQKTCIMVSGMAKFDFVGHRRGWKKEDFQLTARIPAAPTGKSFRLESWVPIVTVNSEQNEDNAVNSGRGVTRFSIRIPDGNVFVSPSVTFIGEVAVRDVDDRITSVAYHATLLGTYVDTPEFDGPPLI